MTDYPNKEENKHNFLKQFNYNGYNYQFYVKFDEDVLKIFILEMKMGKELIECVEFNLEEMCDFISCIDSQSEKWHSKFFKYTTLNEEMELYNFEIDNEILIEISYNETILYSMSLDKNVLPFLIDSFSEYWEQVYIKA